mmetsp:Transcript_35609/g.64156  ORF Transcript_35609/g.64156 Transcript_35609/m.64156 type:complete len:209 (+) Transcript_35609:842-1468(+)
MHRCIIAIDTISLTIIQRILQLPNHIHEDIQIRCPLLDHLSLTLQSVAGKVSISIGELRLLSCKGRLDPMVGVVVLAIVVVKVLEVFVGTTLAADAHLVFGVVIFGKASNGTTTSIVFRSIVCIRILRPINFQITHFPNKTSLRVSLHQSTHLTLHITILQISRHVLHLDRRSTHIVVRVSLTGNLVSLLILSDDEIALFDSGFERYS